VGQFFQRPGALALWTGLGALAEEAGAEGGGPRDTQDVHRSANDMVATVMRT
jgi:hypothetical protein